MTCETGPADETNPACPSTVVCTDLIATTLAGGGTTPSGGGSSGGASGATTQVGGGTGGASTTRPAECNEANEGNYPDESSCKM